MQDRTWNSENRKLAHKNLVTMHVFYFTLVLVGDVYSLCMLGGETTNNPPDQSNNTCIVE